MGVNLVFVIHHNLFCSLGTHLIIANLRPTPNLTIVYCPSGRGALIGSKRLQQ